MSKLPLPDLGAYLREQREGAQLSLRQLADMAGVSNPYLSQIERGLKRPSAEILQQIAKGLQVSAEQLYVHAGILDERVGDDTVTAAVLGDAGLTERQKQVLIEIYESFRRENGVRADGRPATEPARTPATEPAEAPATEPAEAPAS